MTNIVHHPRLTSDPLDACGRGLDPIRYTRSIRSYGRVFAAYTKWKVSAHMYDQHDNIGEGGYSGGEDAFVSAPLG